MPILQKYLGWLQRYWYTVESQAPPFMAEPVIHAVTELANEPFEWKWFRATYFVGLGAGNFSTIFIPSNPERRRLVVYVSVICPTVMAASDNIGTTLIHEGLAKQIVTSENGIIAGNSWMLHGGSMWQGSFDRWVNTARPVMVGPRDTLQVDHVTVVGINDTVTIRALAIDLPKDSPFPNIF